MPAKKSTAQLADGLVNVVSGVGGHADKSRAARYAPSYVTTEQSEAAYRFGSGAFRKIIDIPPYEMTREGRDWQAKPGVIEKLESAETAFDLWGKLRAVETAARLHGLAYLVLGLPGNTQSPAPTPRRDGLKYVLVMGRDQLTASEIDTDLNSSGFGEPKYYEMSGTGVSQRIHPSRVIPVIRQPKPAGARDTQFGGDPMLATIETSMKNVDNSQANVAALLHELKVDTIGIVNLTQMLSTAEGEQRVMKRLQVGQQAASILNSRLLDTGVDGKSGESWETRQLALSGIPEVLREFKSFLAGVSDIPYTRLWGESPGGLNSTGKGEQTDFNRSIRSRQNTDLRPVIDRVDYWLIPSALGSRPSDIYWTFAPLGEQDEETASKVEKTDAETLAIYVDKALIPDSVAADMAKNRIIEGGRWPGSEVSFETAEAAGEVAPLEEDEPEPEEVVPPVRLAVAANDAAPRPLYVRRNLLNGSEFIAWAKSQGFDKITSPDDLHVTVVYSKTPVDWMKMGQAWEGDTKGEITVPPGGARLVEPLGDKGAVVLLFSSDALQWRNKQMLESGASSDFPDYQPHVTITYEGKGVDLSKVEPFRGSLRFGPEIFEEIVDEWRPKLADKLTPDERRTVLDRLWAYLTGETADKK